MKKLIRVLLVSVFFTVFFTGNVFGYSATEHNKISRKILFGSDSYIIKSEKSLSLLEIAAYLAIDQYNNDASDDAGQKALDTLRSAGIKSIPEKISDIDFTSNQFHRVHTHKGWDYNYLSDKAHWNIRKSIMLETVCQLFSFETKYNQQCNSFCALLYYIHLIADHKHEYLGNLEFFRNQKFSSTIMPLIHDHANDSNPDIMSELKKHLAILFKSQQGSFVYSGLFHSLNEIREEAKQDEYLSASAGRSSNKLAAKVLEKLEIYVPKMLKKEDFWKKVFHPDKLQ